MSDIRACHDAAERNAIVQFVMGCPLTMAGFGAENAARMLGIPYRFWCTETTKKDVLSRFPGLGKDDLEVVPTVNGGLDFSKLIKRGAVLSFISEDDNVGCGPVEHPKLFQVNTRCLDPGNEEWMEHVMHEFGAWILKVHPKVLCVAGQVGESSKEELDAMIHFIWQSMLWIHVEWDKVFRFNKETKQRKPYRCMFQPLIVDSKIHYPTWNPDLETDEYNRDLVRKERELYAAERTADGVVDQADGRQMPKCGDENTILHMVTNELCRYSKVRKFIEDEECELHDDAAHAALEYVHELEGRYEKWLESIGRDPYLWERRFRLFYMSIYVGIGTIMLANRAPWKLGKENLFDLVLGKDTFCRFDDNINDMLFAKNEEKKERLVSMVRELSMHSCLQVLGYLLDAGRDRYDGYDTCVFVATLFGVRLARTCELIKGGL